MAGTTQRRRSRQERDMRRIGVRARRCGELVLFRLKLAMYMEISSKGAKQVCV